MNLEDIGTCGGVVTLHFSLICAAILNVLAGMVFCADSALRFLPLLTMGDILNNLLLTEEDTPLFFMMFPQIISLSFSLVLVYGAVKNQARWLYAYLIYGIGRISVALFTFFMLVGNFYGTTDFYIAMRSRYIFTFIGSFSFNTYTLVLVRSSIIDIASKYQHQKVPVISSFRTDKTPLEEKPPKELFIENKV